MSKLKKQYEELFKKKNAAKLAFVQATALVIYLMLLSLFFYYVIPTIATDVPEFVAPIIMLLLFIISAVISATLVLGRAGVLFWEKKFDQAFRLLFATVGWALGYFVVLIVLFSYN